MERLMGHFLRMLALALYATLVSAGFWGFVLYLVGNGSLP
jgi:hypothetical protein